MLQKAPIQISLSLTLGCGCRFLSSFPSHYYGGRRDSLYWCSGHEAFFLFSFPWVTLWDGLVDLTSSIRRGVSSGSVLQRPMQTLSVSVLLWFGHELGWGCVIFTKVVLEMGSESFGSWFFVGELCGHHSENDNMALLCSLWVDFPRILTPPCCSIFLGDPRMPQICAALHLLILTGYRLTFPAVSWLNSGSCCTFPLGSHPLTATSSLHTHPRPLDLGPTDLPFSFCFFCWGMPLVTWCPARCPQWHCQGKHREICGHALKFSKDEDWLDRVI